MKEKRGFECVSCNKDCSNCTLTDLKDPKSYKCLSCINATAVLDNGLCLVPFKKDEIVECGKGQFA